MLDVLLAVLVIGRTPGSQAPGGDVPIDPCESRLIDQVRRAVGECRAARESHGGDRTMTASYEGTARIEAHMMRPGMTREIPFSMELVDDEMLQGLLYREKSASDGRIERTILFENRAAKQIGDGAFKELDRHGPEAADVRCWTPWSVARAACVAGSSCRLSPSTGGETPVTFVDTASRACTIFVDDQHRITRIERLASDQRLGDICCWTTFSDWRLYDGAWVPGAVQRFDVQGSVTIRYELRLASVVAGPVPRETFLPPAERQADLAGWGEARPSDDGVEFVPVEPGVWAVEVNAANARVLVLERPQDLVLLGAPDGDEVCGNLVAALGRRFEGKSIGVAAISHHHPSSSGGLRAIAATGAEILVPRGLEPFSRWLLSRPVELGGPAAAGPREPRLTLFDAEATIDGAEEEVRVIDIGEQSAHAFHFVIFYLPRAGVLFEDDLGFFPANGAARFGPRLAGLVEAIQARGLAPKRLIPAWPVRDMMREVPWTDIESLAIRAREQSKSD